MLFDMVYYFQYYYGDLNQKYAIILTGYLETLV